MYMGHEKKIYSKKARALLWLVHNLNSLELYARFIEMGFCKNKSRGFCKTYEILVGRNLGRVLSYFIGPKRGG